MLLVTEKDLLSSTGDGSIKEKLADGMIFPSKKGRWEFLAPSKQATEVVAIHPCEGKREKYRSVLVKISFFGRI